MSRTGSVTACTTSPEGTNPDSEDLSNWGSVDERSNLVNPAATTAPVTQKRPTRRAAAAGSGGARRTSAPSSAAPGDSRRGGTSNTVAPSSLRGGGGKRVGAGEREPTTYGRLKTNGSSGLAGKSKAAAPASGTGRRRAGSAERPTVSSSSQERPSVAVGATGRRKGRSNSIGSVGKRSSLGSMVSSAAAGRRAGGEDAADHEQELRAIVDLDAAAPSQEEIRLMIDRIRRESAGDDVVGGRTGGSSKAGSSRFEHEVSSKFIYIF